MVVAAGNCWSGGLAARGTDEGMLTVPLPSRTPPCFHNIQEYVHPVLKSTEETTADLWLSPS